MRTVLFGILAGALLVAGCTATAPAGGAKTSTFTLSDGTYIGSFGQYGCGTMVIKNGGQSVAYTSGPCGGAPTFRSSGRFDGQTITIMKATYRLASATPTALAGTWRLGSYTTKIAFKRQ